MSQQVQEALEQLRRGANVQNPDIFTAFDKHQALVIWSEGGEWPKYVDKVLEYSPADVIRQINTLDHYYTNTARVAAEYINSTWHDNSSCAISMDCGQGKSTELIRIVHQLKYGYRTLVIEPSLVVADSIVNYMEKPDTHSVRTPEEFKSQRGIYYMGPGAFIMLVISGMIDTDDCIIIDESHTATLTYSLIEDLVERLDNKLLLMTASTTGTIKARRGVKLSRVTDVTPELSDKLASEPEHVIVGVLDNMTYATPANAIVGLTLDKLRVVYDTGLRPEPRVCGLELLTGERTATTSEILQSVGRLGRSNSSGVAFFNDSAVAMKSKKGIPLYDVLLNCMYVALGIKPGDRVKMANIWASSGFSEAQREVSFAAEDDVTAPESGKSRASSEDYQTTRSANYATSMSSVIDSPMMKSERRRTSTGKTRSGMTWQFEYKDNTGRTAHRSSTATQLLDEEVGTVDSTSDDIPNVVIAAVRTPMGRDRGLAAGMLDMALQVCTPKHAGHTHQKQYVAGRRDIPAIGSVIDRRVVKKYWQAILMSMTRGDSIFPVIIPFADNRIVNYQTEEEARLILSGKIIPSFSEKETMSVITIWNKYVLALGQFPADADRIAMYLNYFRQLYGHRRAFGMEL